MSPERVCEVSAQNTQQIIFFTACLNCLLKELVQYLTLKALF